MEIRIEFSLFNLHEKSVDFKASSSSLNFHHENAKIMNTLAFQQQLSIKFLHREIVFPVPA